MQLVQPEECIIQLERYQGWKRNLTKQRAYFAFLIARNDQFSLLGNVESWELLLSMLVAKPL